MKTWLKRPDPKRSEEIDRLLQGWVKPCAAAAALDLQVSTVYRYAELIGYRRVWIKADEVELIAKYRASKEGGTK